MANKNLPKALFPFIWHTELLAKSGRYKDLWDAQVGGFLGDDQPTPAGFGSTRKTEDVND